MQFRYLWAASAALVLSLSSSIATAEVHPIDIGSTRSSKSIDEIIATHSQQYNLRLATLADPIRTLKGESSTFSMPYRASLTRYGSRVYPRRNRTRANEITLVFETTGSRTFPTEYKDFLQSVFNAAQPAIDAVFGPPAASGNVRVLNYDADIPARNAVAGGVYIHNGTSGQEIRFPVYQSTAAAGVNFIHTILLAYLADREYYSDALEEGLVRAATMTIARVPNSIPNTTPEAIEAVLDSSYDISTFYDYSNRPGVGARRFIAANLLNDPLPAGGSTGGIYLLRHQLAGTAWAKVITEHPSFIKEFNQRFFANPAAFQQPQSFISLGQDALAAAGGPGATIERRTFSDWQERQYILDDFPVAGLKVVPQAFPLAPTPSSNDFGVFGIVLNAFRVAADGTETLLNGTSYPVYWRPDFSRFFASAQDDIINVNGAYGSVVPNFSGDTFDGDPYRVTVDLPFQDRITRVHLPAGAVATGADPDPNNFYGTLEGYAIRSGRSYTVSATWPGGNMPPVTLSNFAFGVTLPSSFDTAQPVDITFSVIDNGSTTETFTRRVNKGKGSLAVQLANPAINQVHNVPRTGRLEAQSVPIEPFRPYAPNVLLLSAPQTLIARYNSFTGSYNLFPNEGDIRSGHGYFFRTPTATTNSVVRGTSTAETPPAIALQSGWNFVSVPRQTTTSFGEVQVTTAADGLSTLAQSQGDIIGNTIFRFNPDPINPDLGTLTAATTFTPGEAYFVRALRPEGAILLFGSATRSNGRTTTGNIGIGNVGDLPGPATRSRQLPPTKSSQRAPFLSRYSFDGSLLIGAYNGRRCHVEIAQLPSSFPGFSFREDSELAPGPGGFQAAIINGRNVYRDVRPYARGTRYTIKIVGLTPGVTHFMQWQPKFGTAKFRVHGQRGFIDRFSAFTFMPNSSTMTFTLETF